MVPLLPTKVSKPFLCDRKDALPKLLLDTSKGKKAYLSGSLKGHVRTSSLTYDAIIVVFSCSLQRSFHGPSCFLMLPLSFSHLHHSVNEFERLHLRAVLERRGEMASDSQGLGEKPYLQIQRRTDESCVSSTIFLRLPFPHALSAGKAFY